MAGVFQTVRIRERSRLTMVNQGLASSYEKTERWPQFIETQLHLADLAAERYELHFHATRD